MSPYSPRGSVDHSNVPSKTLIEAQYVPCPLDRKFSDCGSDGADLDSKNIIDSRRHSCFTDDGEETPRCRYFRTPSVVVSDYSDDVMGLTLEDIEYFRSQRKENSSSPESSLNSSCSNLNYCGSSISNLDAEYILRRPFRKSSDCSSCSTLSGDEDAENTLPVPSKDQVSFCFRKCLSSTDMRFKSTQLRFYVTWSKIGLHKKQRLHNNKHIRFPSSGAKYLFFKFISLSVSKKDRRTKWQIRYTDNRYNIVSRLRFFLLFRWAFAFVLWPVSTHGTVNWIIPCLIFEWRLFKLNGLRQWTLPLSDHTLLRWLCTYYRNCLSAVVNKFCASWLDFTFIYKFYLLYLCVLALIEAIVARLQGFIYLL